VSDELTPGLRDELITAELAQALELLSTDRVDVTSIDRSEAIERMGRHLLRVARRLKSPTNETELTSSAALVNEAIGALGEDFAVDYVETPVRVLRGVRSVAGLADSALPAHPSIPLSTSELMVNGAGEPSLGTVLQQELRCADEVDLICAFVGYKGIESLREELRALVDRGGRVRVITSTYLGSTSGKALDELINLGAEVRVNYQGMATKLHAKAWLFRRPGQLDTAFIGSSNLSEAALYTGLEWNVRLARADAPSVFSRIQQVFDSYWNTPVFERYTLADRERLDAALADARGYAAQGFNRRAQRTIDKLSEQLAAAYAQIQVRPRPHQQRVLDTLSARRQEFDEHRHLLVAATGTGKTVIAALDYARLCQSGLPRPTLLFVAHREQILDQARETFRQVLQDPGFGQLLSGSSGTLTSDAHVFAMVQSLHNRLSQVPPAAYEVIYIDEAHHTAAQSWESVLDHFEPRELVGLTATPERTDGANIADSFGGRFTTELRLWEAVDDQLLAPFEYVGVDDGTDLRDLAWHSGDYAIGALSNLYTGDHERVRRILQAIHRWVEHPETMRALGFCVSVAHAQFMAEQFAKHGLPADYLTGEHDQPSRDRVLARLRAGQLAVVFSVDVLGEGIDVPDVDTLLLCRPTQSPVLFAQQLGRGLRLSPGKASCLVLDFIGQHRAEYRVEQRYQTLVDPVQGDVRAQAEAGFPFLPAGCSITLERVARERVLAALKDVAVRPGITGLLKDFQEGTWSSLESFLERTSRTVEQFYGVDNRKMSWTRLQRAALASAAPKSHDDEALDKEEAELLRRVGYLQHAADGLRVNRWFDWMTANAPVDADALSLAEQRLAMQLMHLLLLQPDSLQEGFDTLWRQPAVRHEIAELLTLVRAELDITPTPLLGLADVPLLAHARYTRAEVFAAVGVSTVDRPKEHREGVYFVAVSQVQLMFVTLHKDTRKFSSNIQYRDHALTAELFHWETPNNWRQQSPATLRCVGKGPEGSIHRLLFVRERGSGPIEGTFRCFGLVDLDGELEGDRPVALTWRLRSPLPEVAFESARLVAAG
jgi:superfamily II DNA or RNA helicase/HKD family nuclease